MKSASSLFSALLLISIFMAGSYGLAADRDTLVDVSGVAVIVEEISEDAEKDGLSAGYLKKLVEEKLTDAGVMVLEERKWFSVFGGAYLLVKFIGSKSSSEQYYIVFVDIELHQTVVLFGKKLGENITTAASTWSTGKLFSCRAPGLKECVGATVGQLTDIFIDDYKTVNTKQQDQSSGKKKKKKR